MTNHKISQFWHRLFRISLFTLPYIYYVSFVGILGCMVYLLKTCRKTALNPYARTCLLIMSGLMICSSFTAFNKGESFLQLANFLPYFLLFSVLPYLMQGVDKLEKIAAGFIIASIPINIISLFEYVLKSPHMPMPWRKWPLVAWVRSAPHKGRAMVMFDHPNALASYLVLMLGLGLGLILLQSLQRHQAEEVPSAAPDALSSKLQSGRGDLTPLNPGKLLSSLVSVLASPSLPPSMLYTGTYLNLVGIFCSGSRNGVIVATSQLIMFIALFAFFVKANRRVVLTGIFGLVAIVAGSAFIGIGGRFLSLTSWANDPRVGVWRIALDLIHERPWLGWGLGNYKLLYPARSVDPDYPFIFHPHNFWLLIATEGGLLLAVVMTLLVGYICFRAMRRLLLRQLTASEGAILIGYLFAFWGCIAFAMLDVTFYDARINVANWVVLAGIYSLVEYSQGISSAAVDPPN